MRRGLLGGIESDGEVLTRVARRQVVVGNLVRQEAVEDGTERETVGPAMSEILHLHVLCFCVCEENTGLKN